VGSDVILFDAGMDPEGHAIDDMLRALRATRDDVKHVFLTHGHFDHVAAAGLYRNAQVHAGTGDLAMMAHRESARPITPRLFGALIDSSSVEPNSPLDERRRIDVGSGKSVLTMPFPGHTPGSFLFLFDGVPFTGDSILLEGGRLTHAMPGNSVDLAQNKVSIRSLAGLLENERVDYVCTGHMWCTAPGMAQELIQRLAQDTL
jgi:glyoxylase-like metal-dependent hydrolase (beta-lactamase superfamily II)